MTAQREPFGDVFKVGSDFGESAEIHSVGAGYAGRFAGVVDRTTTRSNGVGGTLDNHER